MITVIDAMNGMGQDWECAEVLRGEVRRLVLAREERASQYRVEWDGLRALLATAEQRIEGLTDLLREAQGYLNIGLGIYDDITDAIGSAPTNEGRDGSNALPEPAQSDTIQALIEAGGALEQVKSMIEYYFIDHNPNTTAKQTPFTAAAMIYAAVCDSLSRPVLAGLLAKE